MNKKIKYIIKIGGSLIDKENILRKLCSHLFKLANESKYKLIIIPGGGAIADEVRKVYKKYKIADKTAHWMAILSMNINGMLIADLNKNFVPVNNIRECLHTLKENKIPVLLPYEILKKYDELPASWDITSDSISLYIAKLLNAKTNILVKNVEGIYHPKKKILLDKVNIYELKKWRNKTCVDNYYPILTSKYKINSYVVSGIYPERIGKILEGKKTKATQILYE